MRVGGVGGQGSAAYPHPRSCTELRCIPYQVGPWHNNKWVFAVLFVHCSASSLPPTLQGGVQLFDHGGQAGVFEAREHSSNQHWCLRVPKLPDEAHCAPDDGQGLPAAPPAWAQALASEMKLSLDVGNNSPYLCGAVRLTWVRVQQGSWPPVYMPAQVMELQPNGNLAKHLSDRVRQEMVQNGFNSKVGHERLVLVQELELRLGTYAHPQGSLHC